MLRVLFVHQSPELYGSDRVLLEVTRALQCAGGEPIVVLPGEGPLPAVLRERGVEVHTLDDLRVLKLKRAAMTPAGLVRLVASAGASRRALDACVAGRPIDLVYSNTLAVLGGAAWARARGVRHLWHLHEMIERPRIVARLLRRLVRAAADDVVCNSHATRQWLLQSQPALAARTQVIWNGVPDIGASPPPMSAGTAMRAAGRPVAIGLIGRVHPSKGHWLLLEAAELLHARGVQGFTVSMVGGPAPGQDAVMQALRERIGASPLAQRITLRGFTPHVDEVLQELDIVCVPSIVREAFGLVAIEAMSAGKAVVAANIGGLAEVVQHGESGLLHRPGDVRSLAQQLHLLIRHPPLREELAQAGRRRYEAQFTLQAMNERFVERFRALPPRASDASTATPAPARAGASRVAACAGSIMSAPGRSHALIPERAARRVLR